MGENVPHKPLKIHVTTYNKASAWGFAAFSDFSEKSAFKFRFKPS